MNDKVEIPQNILTQMYLCEEKTIEEIAIVFHCSPTTIRRRLKEYKLHSLAHGQRQPRFTPKWSANTAYSIGLMATDGTLSKDGRHLTLTSSDLDLLDTFSKCIQTDFHLDLQVKPNRNYYRIQWSHIGFYNWIQEIGLMPDKSNQLGPIKVPEEYLCDFVRGCLDGDGNINSYIDNRERYEDKTYSYLRLSVRFTSASQHFLEWLHSAIIRHTEARGGIYCHKVRPGQHPFWDLKYGKRDSIRILRWIYYSPDIPYLSRKFARALPFLKEG